MAEQREFVDRIANRIDANLKEVTKEVREKHDENRTRFHAIENKVQGVMLQQQVILNVVEDVKENRESIKSIQGAQNKFGVDHADIKGELKSINYKLDGNGVPGICQEVSEIKTTLDTLSGSFGTAKWILGVMFTVITIALGIITLIVSNVKH